MTERSRIARWSSLPPSQQAPQDGPSDTVVYASECLFAGCRRVVIEHNGRRYRLQRTRQGKLILTR